MPQGSLLGPLLFNIFINDVFNLQIDGCLEMYADDMLVTFESDTLDNLNLKMQEGIIALNEWMMKNDLKINILKTNYIIFNTKGKETLNFANQLYLNNTPIEKVLLPNFLVCG